MKDINYYQRIGTDIICFVKLYQQCNYAKYKSLKTHMREEKDIIKHCDNFNEGFLLAEEYNELCLRFLRGIKKMKHREESKTKNIMYHTLQDFMNHNNLCSDIKTCILSFIS